MRYSLAVGALLVAGQAYASSILPRQSADDLLKMIPPACATPCQGLTGVQAKCEAAPDSPTCACTPTILNDMETCTTCIVKELTASAGGAAGVDPATIKAAIDGARQTLVDTCKAAGIDISSGAGASSSTTAGGAATTSGAAAGTTKAATTSGAPATTSAAATGTGNAGFKNGFAATGLLAAVGGAAALLL
ncbi:hypothetical protein DFP72DRAFT_1169805 [Ephemerocybe angulata]|uniref:Uncharacterized protein n=1 Tax=Ephemerocybe angulata TaxID=980116 RepID=A0A8H6HYD5_9AGAR|nr:hypothetical protein DFP72DRAFT_1169805 [Tulosesus angulatus]